MIAGARDFSLDRYGWSHDGCFGRISPFGIPHRQNCRTLCGLAYGTPGRGGA